MQSTARNLRADAEAIWQAGLAAVKSDAAVREAVRVVGRNLVVGEQLFDLDAVRKIVVVGAGKAGAGMAAGLESALGPGVIREKKVGGWVNVPADCVRKLETIQLHAARPAGRNEPTPEGVAGTEEILRLVSQCDERDLVIALISGGGSALLPAPIAAISLAEKQAITRFLSAAGANIHELNTVRKQLSRIKGGGLARACRAGHLVVLILSDVIGDPLSIIASGPTVPDDGTPGGALAILERFGARRSGIAPAAIEYLEQKASSTSDHSQGLTQPPSCEVINLVIANNALAVDAAGIRAESLGYSHAMIAARGQEPTAEEVGRHLARMALRMRSEPGPDCLITGGEPTVKLADEAIRGRGGRNQQLVLAAYLELLAATPAGSDPLAGICLLSGGTDGEDGPTDAAGAMLDSEIAASAAALGLDPHDALRRNDAYTFFQRCDGLLQTGPTHTNVCDVRVVVVRR